MRLMKGLGVILCVLAIAGLAVATDSLVVRDSNRVTFVAPVRIGTNLLPAGEYIVRHIMEGQDHIMVFQPVNGKGPETRAKCTLVPLQEKAVKTTTIYEMNAANERVLQELIFRGETAKHVF